MSHHRTRKVKPNKTEYLIIIKENQIYNISQYINKNRRYIISLSYIFHKSRDKSKNVKIRYF